MKKLFLSLSLIAISSAASAATLDSTHADWNVYSEGKDTCYIASQPTDEQGSFKKRGQAYVLINSKGKNDEINVSSGYPYKPKVAVEVKVDSKKYNLFSEGEHAWAKSAAADKSIIDTMKKGSKFEVKGISKKGTFSTDTYSLKGITAAYKRMKELCK